MRNRAAHECNLAGPGNAKIADILATPAEKTLVFLARNRCADTRRRHSFVLLSGCLWVCGLKRASVATAVPTHRLLRDHRRTNALVDAIRRYCHAGPSVSGSTTYAFARKSCNGHEWPVGKLRGLAVTTATRSEALPDAPTVGETVLGYEADSLTSQDVPIDDRTNDDGEHAKFNDATH
jgi:hypothetical protein